MIQCLGRAMQKSPASEPRNTNNTSHFSVMTARVAGRPGDANCNNHYKVYSLARSWQRSSPSSPLSFSKTECLPRLPSVVLLHPTIGVALCECSRPTMCDHGADAASGASFAIQGNPSDMGYSMANGAYLVFSVCNTSQPLELLGPLLTPL